MSKKYLSYTVPSLVFARNPPSLPDVEMIFLSPLLANIKGLLILSASADNKSFPSPKKKKQFL